MGLLSVTISVFIILKATPINSEPPGFAEYHHLDSPTVENVNPYYQSNTSDAEVNSNSQFSCKSFGYFPDSNDCSLFYECVFTFSGYSQMNYTCPEGTVYMENIRRCVADENNAC